MDLILSRVNGLNDIVYSADSAQTGCAASYDVQMASCASFQFYGLVGYDTCLTHRRSPVQSWMELIFAVPVNQQSFLARCPHCGLWVLKDLL